MAMIFDIMEDFVLLVKTPVITDGMGGFDYVYRDGPTFKAYMRKDSSTQAEVAQQQGMNEMFTIIVHRDTPLDDRDVIRRVSDGAVFRLTSTTLDAKAPAMSTTPIAKAKCERWAIE